MTTTPEPRLFKVPVIDEIAARHGITSAQLQSAIDIYKRRLGRWGLAPWEGDVLAEIIAATQSESVAS